MAQLILYHARLRIGTIQYRHLLIIISLTIELLDLCSHSLALITVRHIGAELQSVTHSQLGIHRLWYLSSIMANQRISCVHNNLSRTIITLQLEQLSRFIPLLEGQDIFNIRPSKRIDGLCIIAHYAYMILWLSQSLHNQIL